MCQINMRSMGRIGSIPRPSRACRAFALALVSCGVLQTAVAATPPSESVRPVAPAEVEMVAIMERHYGSAIAAHDALIRGDVELLRRRLAEIEGQALPPSAPADWQPHHQRLQEAARAAAAVTDLDAAGATLAAVAEACGSCHAALQPGKIYFWPAPPEGDDKLATAMRTHQWATERMWEGVTGPFEQAWERGAAVLAEARVFGEADAVADSLRKRESVLRELGRSAQSAADPHERALVYGRLLGTCGGCHQEAGIVIRDAKPVPPWRE